MQSPPQSMYLYKEVHASSDFSLPAASRSNTRLSRAWLQGNNDQHRVDLPTARLALVANRSATPRGQVPALPHHGALLHRDMFLLSWGPSVQAVESLLGAAHPDDGRTIADAMRLFRTVRRSLLPCGTRCGSSSPLFCCAPLRARSCCVAVVQACGPHLRCPRRVRCGQFTVL